MNWLHTIILSIVEGLTEYLPVSSTGHLVVASSILGVEPSDFTKAFDVIIQSGAILAVLFLYWRRFLVSKDIYIKLIAAFIPTGIIGFLLRHVVDQMLDSNIIVAASLIVGGFFFWWLEKKYIPAHPATTESINHLSLKECAFIGVIQSIAIIPGVSRSGATICAGLFTGLDRKEATEFSFLLAVPTLLAATAYKSLKIYPTLTHEMTGHLLLGTFLAFVVAVVAIKGFLHFLNRHGFIPFAIYRVLVGILIFIFLRG